MLSGRVNSFLGASPQRDCATCVDLPPPIRRQPLDNCYSALICPPIGLASNSWMIHWTNAALEHNTNPLNTMASHSIVHSTEMQHVKCSYSRRNTLCRAACRSPLLTASYSELHTLDINKYNMTTAPLGLRIPIYSLGTKATPKKYTALPLGGATSHP